MKRVKLLGVLVVAMIGCRVQSVDTPPASSGVTPATPAVITTSVQGEQAASAVLQSKELVVTSTNIFKDLGFIAQSQMASAATSTGTGSCADYGAYTYTSTYNGNGSYNVACTFSLCRQNSFQYDGSFTASGKSTQLTGSLSGLKILNFHNNYKTLIGSLVGGNMSFSMQGSGTASNATYTITANGSMQAFDYYSLGQHNMTFSKLATNYSVSTDTVANTETSSRKTNGVYAVTWSNKAVSITYSDFKVDIQKQLSNNIEDVSMTGRIIVNYSPNSSVEGAFDVVTATPIRTVLVPFPPKTTQGNFTINGTATAAYGSSDTISVSVAGDTTLSYAKEFMLMKQTDFYAMKQQLPIVSGPTGTTTGTIMSISALSTGATTSDLNCYTDVHVNYYKNTSPTVIDSLLWYVDWHQNLSSCKQQLGLFFQQGTSSTGVTGDPCDVGLDINGADFDITSGGVEHFLAAALPVGYYVLSINNYSCATTVHNAASLLIGDYLFGTYNCSYTSSDGESTDAGAWCRLADVRVNADGTIDVLPPALLLNPWHQ